MSYPRLTTAEQLALAAALLVLLIDVSVWRRAFPPAPDRPELGQ